MYDEQDIRKLFEEPTEGAPSSRRHKYVMENIVDLPSLELRAASGGDEHNAELNAEPDDTVAVAVAVSVKMDVDVDVGTTARAPPAAAATTFFPG